MRLRIARAHKREIVRGVVLGIYAGFCVVFLMFFWPIVSQSLALEILKVIITVDGILIAFFGVSCSRLLERGDFALAFFITEISFILSILFAVKTMSELLLFDVIQPYNFIFEFAFMFAGLAQQAYLIFYYIHLMEIKFI